MKKKDILKDLSNDIFSSEEQNINLEQQPETNVDNEIFSVETPNDIFIDMANNEKSVEDNSSIESQLNVFETPVDMSLQQESVSENTNVVSDVSNINEEATPKEEINFDKINEILEETIQESNKQFEVSLNDINTILENHFNDVETASEVSFNELEEKVVDDDLNAEDALDEALMDYKDEDITFNDLNNMTQEINLEELNAVLEQIDEEKEHPQEEIIKAIEEEVEEKVDITIESTFPRLDKFGSVFPRKSI